MKSTRRESLVVAAVVLFVIASPVMAVTQFKDGGVWDINYQISDHVWVDYLWINWESPETGTTLNLLDGGRITGILKVYEYSHLNISGGSIEAGLYAYDSSQITISGGWIDNELQITDVVDLTIDGSDFAVDGAPVGYTELTSILGLGYRDEPYRRLTGTLLNGEPINNDFRIGQSAKIVLVPEPATIFLFGFGSLVLFRKTNSQS